MRLTTLMAMIALGTGLGGQAMAASITRADFGVTTKGEKVSLYTLTNDHGMRVKILDYGGTITAIDVPDKAGNVGNVVLDLGPLKAYEARANFSSLIGRFANRISGGGFTLDRVRYDLLSSPEGVSSHGGTGGFSTKVWKATTFKGKGKTKGQVGVVLSYVSADGENGFPGQLTTQVRFTLDAHNQLTLDYEARTDKPTVLNLTHHAFFNLAGSGTATGHSITIAADQYLPMNDKKIVTGEIAAVADTPLDLRAPKLVADVIAADYPQIKIAKGVDHTYVLTKAKPGAFAQAAILSEPSTGRVMTVSTTEPGIQFYSGGGFNGSLIDAVGKSIQATFGLALETQHFPNSPNIAGFPSTVLRPGEVFRSKTRYAFSVK